MKPTLHIARLTFSDGTVVALEPDDAVLIVGPNNAGKSAAIRAIRDKIDDPANPNPVVLEVESTKSGTADDLVRWLRANARERPDSSPNDPIYKAFGVSVRESTARRYWDQSDVRLGDLGRFFVHLLSTEERLTSANPAQAIALARDPLAHPIHYLQHDDHLEAKLSAHFNSAFGTDLIVHRNAGSEVPLYTGPRPAPDPGKDRVSLEYIQELEKLTPLRAQGDGMRSFVGVLLHAIVGVENVLLIDEPEAFLHPPQARQLGRMLIDEKPIERQILISTHSGDVLRGLLDSEAKNVRILRIQRAGSVNLVRELNNDQVRELWNDPLLRHSNVLDGLFHERVIIAEADGDCRFYSAVLNALLERDGKAGRRPDIMWVHTGGKARVPIVAKALHGVGVPVGVIVDFDILNAEQPLRGIIESVGGQWSAVSADWRIVKLAVEAKRPELSSTEVAIQISQVLAAVKDTSFPNPAKHQIQSILKRSSPWAAAKEAGKSIVPPGQPTQAYERLSKSLRSLSIWIVEVGELECFCRSIGNHGVSWVNEALKQDLVLSPDFAVARAFVRQIALPSAG